jgi:hypothetical protein
VLGDGRSASTRYANNSNYRNDSLIRKESERHCTACCRCVLIVVLSVREPCCGQRDQADCQRQRDIEVCKICMIVDRTPSNLIAGRTTPSGHRRTRMVGKSWRLGWAMNTFPLRYAFTSVATVRRTSWKEPLTCHVPCQPIRSMRSNQCSTR